MICDSHGNPLDFVLTQGQVHDCTQSSILLAGRTAVAVIADKGYDDNKTRTNVLDMSVGVVIPHDHAGKPRSNTTPTYTRPGTPWKTCSPG
jgi:transposase